MNNELILKDIEELNHIAFSLQHTNKKKALDVLWEANKLGLNLVTDKYTRVDLNGIL